MSSRSIPDEGGRPARSGGPHPGVLALVSLGIFLASLITVIAIGVILDATGQDFKAAMSFQYVLWGLGLVQVWRYRQRTRARVLTEDPDYWLPESTRGRRLGRWPLTGRGARPGQ